MVKLVRKHQLIYLFLLVISLVGFGSGYMYYGVQDTETKELIKEEYKLNESLKISNTNFIKDFKLIVIGVVGGILIIPQFITIICFFYSTFKYGFLFSYLTHISFSLGIKYMFIYHFIPFIFFIILLRISFSMSYEMIQFLLIRKAKNLNKVRYLLYKYIFFVFFLFLYELVISIFSLNINKSFIPFL